MDRDHIPDEQDLVRRAQGGDRTSLALLIVHFSPPLQGYFAVRTRSYDSRQDLVQETWRRICEGLDRFDATRGFSPWLFGIARRVASECRKDPYKRRSRPLEAVEERLQHHIERELDSVPEPLALLHGSSLNACLESLPEKERGIVDQHYGQGVPLVDLARTFSLSPVAVRVWLFRIRHKLRLCLQGKASGGRGESEE